MSTNKRSHESCNSKSHMHVHIAPTTLVHFRDSPDSSGSRSHRVSSSAGIGHFHSLTVPVDSLSSEILPATAQVCQYQDRRGLGVVTATEVFSSARLNCDHTRHHVESTSASDRSGFVILLLLPISPHRFSRLFKSSDEAIQHLTTESPANPQSRQTNRPPNPGRAQSLLRERANLPLMAQFHRDPRRPRSGTPQLRRPHRSHLRRPFHRHRHGGHDLRRGNISLASAKYPTPRPERIRRSFRSDNPGYCLVGGRCGEFHSADAER